MSEYPLAAKRMSILWGAIMDWVAFWSAVLGSAVPGSAISLLMLYLTHRNNREMERHKTELQQTFVKFTKLHDKRLEALITIYNGFCDVLDFLRRNLYAETTGVRMDPMHDFFRTIERQIVYLDDSMAEKVHRYQGELLQFWNWAIIVTSEEGEEARTKVRYKLDHEIPAYLPRLRQDINQFLDPNYKNSGRVLSYT
jgi:hypothetical protein